MKNIFGTCQVNNRLTVQQFWTRLYLSILLRFSSVHYLSYLGRATSCDGSHGNYEHAHKHAHFYRMQWMRWANHRPFHFASGGQVMARPLFAMLCLPHPIRRTRLLLPKRWTVILQIGLHKIIWCKVLQMWQNDISCRLGQKSKRSGTSHWSSFYEILDFKMTWSWKSTNWHSSETYTSFLGIPFGLFCLWFL